MSEDCFSTDATPDPSGRDAMRVLLQDAIVQMAMAQMEKPHIVIAMDEETGCSSYLGPFADGIAALVAASQEERRTSWPHLVVPLDEPIDGGGPSPSSDPDHLHFDP